MRSTAGIFFRGTIPGRGLLSLNRNAGTEKCDISEMVRKDDEMRFSLGNPQRNFGRYIGITYKTIE